MARRRQRAGAAAAATPGRPAAAAGRGRVAAQVAGGGPTIYKMRQRMVAIGDDFFIENDKGRRVFKVDGKALRVRDTLLFQTADGRQDLYRIQERMLRVRDTMQIETAQGRPAAHVQNAFITPLRDRWTIRVPGGADISTRGNVLQHNYRIERNNQQIAEVSKRWFRLRDSYGVEIQPGQDDALILLITVCIDMMAHEGR